jgi:hypothetical protein
VREKLNNLIVEYGAIGLVVYLTSTALVYLGFWIALQFGWRPSGATGNIAFWGTAYVAAKVTQPFRIAGTLIATPFIARIYERVTGRRIRKETAGTTTTTHPN